jgi:hypothetical protein
MRVCMWDCVAGAEDCFNKRLRGLKIMKKAEKNVLPKNRNLKHYVRSFRAGSD